MTIQMTREQWLANLLDLCEPVGDCVEWQGPLMGGKTPLAYVPRGYVLPEWSQSRQSARAIFWALFHEARPPAGCVIRSCCRNDRCVAVEHMVCIQRTKAPAEQGRRGEFTTPKRTAAAIRRARARGTKLNEHAARAIRGSSEPSKVLALVYGVSSASINAVRRGDLWPEAANGSSVFNWRPAA